MKIGGVSVCFSLAFELECAAHVVGVLVIALWRQADLSNGSWSLTVSSMRTLYEGVVGEDGVR